MLSKKWIILSEKNNLMIVFIRNLCIISAKKIFIDALAYVEKGNQ